jgi:hypothetical protein
MLIDEVYEGFEGFSTFIKPKTLPPLSQKATETYSRLEQNGLAYFWSLSDTLR